MEHLNFAWFSALYAGANLHGIPLWLSVFAAKYLVIFVVIGLLGLWLWGPEKHRATLLLALAATAIAFVINWLFGIVWYHPRPFELGLGQNYLHHAPNSSFPSDHATALFTMCFVFFWRDGLKSLTGLLLLVSAFVVSWARIFLAAHFPFDILGAVLVALVSVVIVLLPATFIEKKVLPAVERVYRKVFAWFIKNEWVRN
jgi:undecaprenyl-diphosphatase